MSISKQISDLIICARLKFSHEFQRLLGTLDLLGNCLLSSCIHTYVRSLGRVSVGPILEEDMTLTVFNGKATFTKVSIAEQIVSLCS